MFPLTRQSFVKSVLVLLCLTSGLCSQKSVYAQAGGAAAPPPAAGNAPAKWTPPSWYMDTHAAEKFEREKIGILQFLKTNNPSNAQVKELSRVADYYLSKITHDDVRQSIPKAVNQRLLSDVLTPSALPNGRAALLDEILKKIPAILNHPSDVVRTNTLLLLTEMSIEPSNFQKKTPAVPYTPAHKILIQILEDSQQNRECKIIASIGLARICRDDINKSLSSNERSDVANALTKAIQTVPVSNEDEDWWYRFRLVEALGFVNRLDNVNGDPVVIDTILATLSNPKEHLLVRSQAALSISRLPLAGSTNVQLITSQISKLLLRLSFEFMKDPKSEHWRDYFSRVFLSFRPESQVEADKGWGLLYQVRKGGLGGNSAYVEAAFERAMPIFKAILQPETPTSIPASILKTFQEWVQNNLPSNKKVTPASKALE